MDHKELPAGMTPLVGGGDIGETGEATAKLMSAIGLFCTPEPEPNPEPAPPAPSMSPGCECTPP